METKIDLFFKCSEFMDAAERELSIYKKAQLFRNHDLTDNSSGPGSSVYTQMNEGKVRSVSEFRKKNIKRRKKQIKKLLDQKHM